MSVTIRPYVNGAWEADIRVALPDGTVIRPSGSTASCTTSKDVSAATLLNAALIGSLPD